MVASHHATAPPRLRLAVFLHVLTVVPAMPTSVDFPEGASVASVWPSLLPSAAQCTEDSTREQAHHIIHGAAALAALADGSLAQIPGTGQLLIPTIQAAMVFSIGHLHGCHLDLSHALAIVTYLASNHMKKAFVKEMFGFIPGVGNLIKTSVTWVMTEAIGNVAEKILRCGNGGDELIAKALASKGAESKNRVERGKHLFHFVSVSLLNMDLQSWSAKRVWINVKRLISMQDQHQLITEVQNAADADELAQMVQQHIWNLEVVEAALSVLGERFNDSEACFIVDFVAARLWIAVGIDADARLIVSQYLLSCLVLASSETQASIVRTASSLIIGTQGGIRGGISPLLVQRAIELLKLAFDSGVQTGSLLSEEGRSALLTALLEALARGEPPACDALRALLKAERWEVASGALPGSQASLRHLQRLDRLEAPLGAEHCLPALQAQLHSQLRLPALPSEAELPPQSILRACGRGQRCSGGAGLLERLAEVVLGQRCALERLLGHPGLVRLKHRGLWRGDMPMVLLFTGPSGTGKTLLARSLAEVLHGQSISELERSGRFRTFHMSFFSLVEDQKSFFGPPRGIKGSGDLPELLKEWPDAIVLLDEVEKAHPSFARALLKVFGENGAVYDPSTGRDVPTTNATFILTSNLGKDLIATHRVVGTEVEEDLDCMGYALIREDVLRALREPYIGGRENFFRESELRGRLTDVVPFLPFSAAEVEVAVRRFLAEEARTFAASPEFAHAALAWEPAVVPALASEYVRRPEEGLRGVHVQLQARVREVLEVAIAAGLLEASATALLRAPPPNIDTGGRLDLRVVAARSSKPARHGGAAAKVEAAEHGRTPVGGGPSSGGRAGAEPEAGQGQAVGALQWERLHAWDWELAWQQAWEFLWEWRLPLLLFIVMVFSATSATFMPSMTSGVSMIAPSVATAVPTATPTVVTSVAAASWVPSIVALVQLAAGAGSVAVPVLTAAYAWQNRHEIAALAWAMFALVILPVAARFMHRQWTSNEDFCRQKCVPHPRAHVPRGHPKRRGCGQTSTSHHQCSPNPTAGPTGKDVEGSADLSIQAAKELPQTAMAEGVIS
mmetsp:Transcript_13551/g.37608  ORF Transcript_13551/g.37608 Transcript_13551/m.37608 type:complete len:1079 (-) Transcript_13551:182-3418(-)